VVELFAAVMTNVTNAFSRQRGRLRSGINVDTCLAV
jgi:hypothetical protein